MSIRRARRSLAAALVVAAAVSGVPSFTAASAGEPGPVLRLIALRDRVTVRHSPGPIRIDPQIVLSPRGADLRLTSARADYDSPVESLSHLPGGGTVVLPDGTLEGWEGLTDVFRIVITDRDGGVRFRRTVDFCPNVWRKTRLGPDGPSLPVYPSYCSWNPFTLGMVYGIEQDWGAHVADGLSQGTYLRLPVGTYRYEISIAAPYLDVFEVDPDRASASVRLKVRAGRHHEHRVARTAAWDPERSVGVPIVRAPGDAGLPDLQPLPSWSIGVRRIGQRDRMTFAANVWVGGNGPLVVEGFRREHEAVMDAYQYFWEDGEPVGKARVGEMEYDERRDHQHWHFKQFAAYELLAADRTTVVKSSKEAFCLVPTDAIDLTLPAAELQPGNVGLWTSCGNRNDRWIREVLPVGWGDTYYQYVAGQSFDVSDVPNGTYFVKVVANPGRQLHELRYDNNVRLRKVILSGTPGHRRVEVPPWHGIDSERSARRHGLAALVG
jgi:hypothetical protein